jgi:hypothetical protein
MGRELHPRQDTPRTRDPSRPGPSLLTGLLLIGIEGIQRIREADVLRALRMVSVHEAVVRGCLPVFPY